MTGGAAAPPLHVQMRALAAAGHEHAKALERSATELEQALEALDGLEHGTGTGGVLRDVLRAQHRARLTWWRATGGQLTTL